MKCSRRGISLYIGNSVKLLFQLKTNKFYISAYNKRQFNHLKRTNTKIDIIGSAHNICEINEKIRQGCRNILLSRLFKTNYKNKKGWLGTIKFNLLTRKVSANFVALGGINEKNFNQLKILNITGLAMSSDKKKPVITYRLFIKIKLFYNLKRNCQIKYCFIFGFSRSVRTVTAV